MVKKYFTGANTAGGYVDLIESNLEGITRIYGLSGASKKHKSEILEGLLERVEEKYEEIECVISPFDITIIACIIIRDIKTAIVDTECIKGMKAVKIFDVGDNKTSIDSELARKEKWAIGELYSAYGKGKVIHDEWEQIYIQNMDFKRLESYENTIINELLRNKQDVKGTQNYHRFFGASTPDGSVNYIDNITENLDKRLFIKGRPGTGKSTFLKRLAKMANEKGFDTEIYYCSFDKDSLDMVVVPQLSFCVFDSTAPHEMFPRGEGDKILDFYEESGLMGVDEKFESKLADIRERYQQKMAEGMAYLRLCKLYMKEQEYYLSKQVSRNEFSSIKKWILSEIL